MNTIIAAATHDPKVASTGNLMLAAEMRDDIDPADFELVAEELERRGVSDFMGTDFYSNEYL